ncbi:MAG: hypothetical protein HKN23_16460, partial [Verrucomicrobiales bacterium]|nr:hypothetical protein [Verrucomicrobiales bacterium]
LFAAGCLPIFPAFGARRWIREQIRREIDPLSGSQILQLTSAAAISHDIYGEQLYCSADGNRIAFLRCGTTDHRDGPMDLFISDIKQRGVKLMGKCPFFLVGGNGREDTLFYTRETEDGKIVITKINFTTLEQEDVFAFGECPVPEHRGLLAVSPDHRWAMILRRLGGRRYGVERIDLKNKTWELIHEKDDIFNAHLQFNPAGGELMIQHNRGGELDEDFNVIRSVGPEGATLYTIDSDGKNERPLPVGKPYTTPVTGHECFIGETGNVILTCRGGKVYRATPGGEKADLIAVGAGFMHITASPDGKFFVVDDIKTGRLSIGCIATRKILPLCDSGTSGGSPQYTHSHPYITPGNRHVIYNSDRTGIAQVYAASIPEDLLAELETK